jgi:hypothetical protein
MRPLGTVAAVLALLTALTGTAAAATEGTGACRPLGTARGRVIDVGPADAARLPQIARDAPAGATIRLADGRYPVSDAGGVMLARRGLTLRSASGDPAAVVIDGDYGPSALVRVSASGVTIADLTLTRAQDHLVHAVPPEGGRSISGMRVQRVRLVDSGEQFVKSNPNASRTGVLHRSRVSCSSFEMTAEGRTHIERAFGCYTGGIDAHGASGWRVRRNRFEGIYCEDGEVAEHAVHFWRRSRGTLVENNLVVNCSRGIGFGLGGDAADGHTGGVIRRNAIVADIPQYDTGIGLEGARGVRVLHNTVAETDRATGAFGSIDVRFRGTSAVIANNLYKRTRIRDGAHERRSLNIDHFPLAWLVDAAAGDVHLRGGAEAINHGVRVPDAGRDLDGAAQPLGRPDVGVDEFGR